MKEFSSTTRKENLKKLKTEVFDFVVIGGGITGAGVARDAASRGLKVALIEGDDFASGTSSRSSKLIHGGIRYLENYDFALVFEALSERQKLFEIAPHLVHPLRFVLPVYEGGRVGMFLMGIGMWLYDALALFDVPALHERLGKKASLNRVPSLNEKGLLGAYVYSDAYMDDDRMVIETLRSANVFGATQVNFVTAIGAKFLDDRVTAVTCKDILSGEEFTIKGRHFISSVGPWTDRLANTLFSSWKKILRPSKGIHLTFQRDKLPLGDAVVMSTRSDKRIIFGIPRHEMVIVGTTDTDFDGDPKDVRVEPEDVKYLLGIVNGYFPGANISAGDIVGSYAGVRPLVADDASTESQTSREHIIIEDPRNVTFVAGGKYTTYRHMAKQTVDTALKTFPAGERARYQHSLTDQPLNELASQGNLWRAQRYFERWSKLSGLPASECQMLAFRHGLEAEEIILTKNVGTKKTIWVLEALHAIKNTMCLNILDFYTRRSPLMLAEKDHGLSFIESIATIFARELNWTDAEKSNQIQKVKDYIKSEYAWKEKI